jgi:glycosyltransferase involved in cell wall biosynthesis
MSKPFLLFRGPVKTMSGYGAHSRDILQALYELDLFDIKIDSCAWGVTPMTALNKNKPFHIWIENNIISSSNATPDVYVQVTVPNEFKPIGKYNIGITAGIETTIAPKDWIDGCNRMDSIIVTSNFSKEVLVSTVYNENENNTGKLVKQHRITKNIDVLFEGVDTSIYKNTLTKLDKPLKINVKEDFCYLFVGHWLKGSTGQDRKDVGMLIKVFCETFKGEYENKPALVLKTSSTNFSVKAREEMRKKIEGVVAGIENPPSVYLIFGELTDDEMNNLYNHPKIKSMVTLTKGEGFGRPLLEFSMTGKPIIASNWSGHRDFLPIDKAILIGGSLTPVHQSAVDSYVLADSKWFTANYDEFSQVIKIVHKDYETFTERSEKLREQNHTNFSFEAMKNKLKNMVENLVNQPKMTKLVLPKLEKIN